jgi:hypothetical protein
MFDSNFVQNVFFYQTGGSTRNYHYRSHLSSVLATLCAPIFLAAIFLAAAVICTYFLEGNGYFSNMMMDETNQEDADNCNNSFAEQQSEALEVHSGAPSTGPNHKRKEFQ